MTTIDPTTEQLLPPTRVARQVLPQAPSPVTLYRWQTRGVVANGQRVVLETVKVGRRRYTTEDAFRRFIAAQNTPATSETAEARTDARVQELKAAGLA